MGTPLVLTQQVDATTWQALGLVLTLVGLALSVVVWRSRGAGHGLRAAGWSLVPLAAGMTGLLRLAWEVLDALLGWAVSLVFSPLVWLGFAVALVALALHVAGGVLVRRSRRTSGRPAVGAAQRGEPEASPASAASPAAARQPRRQRKQEKQLVDDQDDIEAILRKHGIS